MRTAEDILVATDRTPADFAERVEALDYWHRRQRDLPWYRRGARREATRMAEAWEGRVAEAAAFARDVHPLDRGLAGLLVARSWGRRSLRRLAWRIQSRALVLVGLLVVAYAAIHALL